MISLARKTLSAFIGATMVATPLAACAAEEVSSATTETSTANENTQTSSSAQPFKLQFVDVQSRSINDSRTAAADASHNKVAIVVWGGNRAIQQEAYNAARDLAGIGIPTVFILAPDTNGLKGDASFQIYARSEPRFDGSVGKDNAEDLRPLVRQAGLDTYKETFPQRVATLSIR